MTLAIFLLTVTVVVWAAGYERPGLDRLQRLSSQAEVTVDQSLVSAPAQRGSASRMLAILGRPIVLTRVLQPHLVADDATWVGGVVVLSGSFALLEPALALCIFFGGLVVPTARRRHQSHDRRREIRRALPLTVDLLRLGVASGLNITHALAEVVVHTQGALAEELRRALTETHRGLRLADALDGVIDRTSEETRAFVSALVSAERYGAPLSVVLERMAHEARLDQERQAEQAARRLSVQLLFPVAGCTLPAFALLTVAPLLAGAFGSLAPSFS